MTAIAEEITKPVKLSAEDKIKQTNKVVRDILDAETTAREKKTEKLRALRLAQETAKAESPPKKKASGRR